MPARPRRRETALGVAVLTVLTLTGAAASAPVPRPYAERALLAQTALLAPGDTVVPVGPDADPGRVEGTNVAAGSDAALGLADAQRAWLAAGTVPGPDRYDAMARQALLDLDTLTLDNGAVLAGPVTAWRYSWPRDASFVAVALARTGHVTDAATILGHLARVQEPDGTFQARYLPDESGVPDDRGTQLDGGAWFLWAAEQWHAAATAAGDGDRDATLTALRPALTRALAALEARVDTETGLPTPSPDYWEVRETTVTLGLVAPMLLGARSVQALADEQGSGPGAAAPTWLTRLASRAEVLETRLEHGIATTFAPAGYPRHDGGTHQDAAVAFLMPPFAPATPDVSDAWRSAAEGMARPAGGLAPGEGWKSDGISWTPQTALFALTAAGSGDVQAALSRLDWLDAHRTAAGSLPEKVLWDGRPAELAPLAWTSALVLLTLDELDRSGATG